jgi:hypothetical protein
MTISYTCNATKSFFRHLSDSLPPPASFVALETLRTQVMSLPRLCLGFKLDQPVLLIFPLILFGLTYMLS